MNEVARNEFLEGNVPLLAAPKGPFVGPGFAGLPHHSGGRLDHGPKRFGLPRGAELLDESHENADRDHHGDDDRASGVSGPEGNGSEDDEHEHKRIAEVAQQEAIPAGRSLVSDLVGAVFAQGARSPAQETAHSRSTRAVRAQRSRPHPKRREGRKRRGPRRGAAPAGSFSGSSRVPILLKMRARSIALHLPAPGLRIGLERAMGNFAAKSLRASRRGAAPATPNPYEHVFSCQEAGKEKRRTRRSLGLLLLPLAAGLLGGSEEGPCLRGSVGAVARFHLLVT